MKDWSKLEGKKVIMLGCDILNPIDIGVIVGCDQDIGICIAEKEREAGILLEQRATSD